MKMPSRLVANEALNARLRNNPRSIIGSARPSWRRTKTTPTASPARSDERGSQPIPSWAISLRPNTIASTATSNMAALARSSRPAPGSRYSGSTRGPSTSSSTITGTASRIAGDPHPDGGRALPGIGEHREDQGQRGRRQGRPSDPQQRPAGDQHLGAGGEGRDHRDPAEGGGAEEQQPAAADPVAQGAHGDQEA